MYEKQNHHNTFSNDSVYLEEATKRGASLCYIGAIGFAFFGVVSLGFIQAFDPSVDFFANMIPRVLFNSLPMLALAYILQHTKMESESKLLLWMATFPIVLSLSSAIHIFRLISAGHTQIYYFVHGPHLIALTSFYIYLAPPKRLFQVGLLLALVFFIAPHAYFLSLSSNKILLSLYISDWILALFALVVTTLSVIHLRNQIGHEVLQTEINFVTTPAQAEKRSMPQPEVQKNLVQVFVLRSNLIGLGAFASHMEIDLKRKFLDYYNKSAAKRIAEMGGHWHKSNDNAHLATFGLNSDNPTASLSKSQIQDRLQKSLQTVQMIMNDFYHLKDELHLPEELCLGLSLDFGPLELEVHTSGRRKQLEISGSFLHRSTRLEEYAQVIKKYFRLHDSIVVFGPGLETLETRTNHHTIFIDSPDLQVKGHPEIQKIQYLTFSSQNF